MDTGETSKEDPTMSEVYNRRIRQFQAHLANVIDQARRAF